MRIGLLCSILSFKTRFSRVGALNRICDNITSPSNGRASPLPIAPQFTTFQAIAHPYQQPYHYPSLCRSHPTPSPSTYTFNSTSSNQHKG
ncbi:hypothetical protein F5Y04DRAFT_241743 [Hypomontagnella monticulosa]|nr:hypothetical protein F5Y04DRAFT_241743 [Hypomontagnella monticulosa]